MAACKADRHIRTRGHGAWCFGMSDAHRNGAIAYVPSCREKRTEIISWAGSRQTRSHTSSHKSDYLYDHTLHCTGHILSANRSFRPSLETFKVSLLRMEKGVNVWGEGTLRLIRHVLAGTWMDALDRGYHILF